MKIQDIVVDWERFKKIVRSKGYSFASLGKATGLGRRNIENMKDHDPGFSKMVKISDALEVSLDKFK